MAQDEGAGIYSATYSGIPVFEYQFGVDLKEHVMRRRHDDWINATHILKAAGFDKPARTRILEREVQKDDHEKIQGGYGKYQGTWIPLEQGKALARRNNVYDRLQPIFEYVMGDVSPPPAPRHTSKPKAPRARPAVPKWTAPPVQEDLDMGDLPGNEDDTPDNLTVASMSYVAEDEHQDMSNYSAPMRKRKREEAIQDETEQHHYMYGDALLDYFLLSRNEQPAIRPDPPTNFQPNWIIDTEKHTALHWACAMGDVEVIKQLKRFGAGLSLGNERGETPFMRAVSFTNCYEKKTFPAVMKELFETVDVRDKAGCTIIHHAAIMKSGRVTSQSCARYYLDYILNRLQETHDPNFVQQLIDAQDNDGNTAMHLAAAKRASKCVRALVGRGASTDIANRDGVRAEDLIRELNATKKTRVPQRSSSPFGQQDRIGGGGHDDGLSETQVKAPASYQSEAATAVHSRITPLIFEKFRDLSQSYEEEFGEKVEAEREAQRVLNNTQSELMGVRAKIADLEPRIEPDDVASKTVKDAELAQKQLIAVVTEQTRKKILADVYNQLGTATDANGGVAKEETNGHDADLRLDLARELQQLVMEQRQAEADYVDALAAVGTSDNIEKYRRLLQSCLGQDAESLEDNIDGMIAMMEEEASDSARNGGVESVEVVAI